MPEPLVLEATGLTVRFGGAIAVDALNLRAPQGQVTGLIGPNGAGKTTTFNACCGLTRPTAGEVRLGVSDVTRSSPQHHAQLGMGRTFQRMELFDSLTVARNVSLGLEAKLAGRSPLRHLIASRTQRVEVADATADAMERCGVAHLAHQPAGGLSTGQRRLVELARAVTGGFRLLLLDEPSSGLDHAETATFADVLRDLVREKGLGLLLVEHDMGLVMSTCDYIFVLDFGKLIFEGGPVETQASQIVREAYLGQVA